MTQREEELISRLLSRAEFEDNGGTCDRSLEDVGALLREAASAIVATPKPEANPEESVATVAEIGAGGHRWLVPHPLSALDHLPIGTPLYAHPPKPEATEGGEHEKGIEAAREACLDCDFVVPTSVLRKAIAAYLNETEVGK